MLNDNSGNRGRLLSILADPAVPASVRDAELLRNIAAGVDVEDSLSALMEIYAHQLQRVFHRRGFSIEDCEDLTQMTFVKVLENAKSFRSDGAPNFWIFRIALNTANTYHKSLKRRDRSFVSLEEQTGDAGENHSVLEDRARLNPLDNLLNKQTNHHLGKAAQRLAPQRREIFRLWAGGSSYEEIAEIVNMPVNTVRTNILRGRKAMREALLEQGEVSDNPPLRGR